MRTVKYTCRFKRDYRREKSGQRGKKLDSLLMDVVNPLAADISLPGRTFDHALAGEWKDHAIATFAQILSSFIGSPATATFSLSGSVLIANLACDLRLRGISNVSRRGKRLR